MTELILPLTLIATMYVTDHKAMNMGPDPEACQKHGNGR